MRRVVGSRHHASWRTHHGISLFVCLAFLLNSTGAKPNMTFNINLINNYSGNSTKVHPGLVSHDNYGVKVSLPGLNPATAETSSNPYSSVRQWKSKNEHSNGESQPQSDINENNEAHLLSTIDGAGKMSSVLEPPGHLVNNQHDGGEGRAKTDVSVIIYHHRAMHDPLSHYHKGKPWHYYANGYGLNYGYDLDGKYAREKGYQYEKALGRERCKSPKCSENYPSRLMKNPRKHPVQKHIYNTFKRNNIDLEKWLNKGSQNKATKPLSPNIDQSTMPLSSSSESVPNDINLSDNMNLYSKKMLNTNTSPPKLTNKTMQFFVVWQTPESPAIDTNQTTPRDNGPGGSNRHRINTSGQDNVVALFSNSNVYVTDQSYSKGAKLVNAHPSSTNVFMPGGSYLRRAKLYDFTPRPLQPQMQYVDHYQHHYKNPSESKDNAKQTINPAILTQTKIINKQLNPSKVDSSKWISKLTSPTAGTQHWYIKPNKNWGANNNFGVEDATKMKSMPLNPKMNRHLHKTNTNLVRKKKIQLNENPYSQKTW